MRLTVIGTGYVGIISAVGWAGLGHSVTCVDVDKAKVEKIMRGVPPIYEKGLEARLKKALAAGNLSASTDYGPVAGSDVVLISVGTPSKPDGSMDTAYVRSAADAVAGALKRSGKFTVVAVRSTVVPGTTETVVGKAMDDAGLKAGSYGLAMIPEFLKEGTAIEDFDGPDRVVAGVSDSRARDVLAELYAPFSCEKLFTDIRTAEMIKYASNAMLATKVTFANEVAGFCERMGIDVDEVMRGVGMDGRIGPQFLSAGPGFGGSCFPKDVKALAHEAARLGAEPRLLKAVLDVNELQKTKLVTLLESAMPLKGKTVAVLGLAFKAGTDDIRESPALAIIRRLLDAGCRVQAYDPQAMGNMKAVFPEITYAAGWEECLKGCDGALVVTSWKEFRKSAADYKRALGSAPLADAWRMLPAAEAGKAGLAYYCIGRGRKG